MFQNYGFSLSVTIQKLFSIEQYITQPPTRSNFLSNYISKERKEQLQLEALEHIREGEILFQKDLSNLGCLQSQLLSSLCHPGYIPG